MLSPGIRGLLQHGLVKGCVPANDPGFDGLFEIQQEVIERNVPIIGLQGVNAGESEPFG